MHLAGLDEQALKLYIDEKTNIVWFTNRDGPVTNSGLTLLKFQNEPIFKNAKHFRLIGNDFNAALIVKLHALKRAGEIKHLDVCSPLVCLNNAERNDPEVALLEMRRWSWSPSLGGWHETDENDYHHYLLAVETNRANFTFTDHTKRLLKAHPAWKHLSFISHLDINLAAKLLGLLLDPRWYIDFNDPNSGAKLKAFLGLTPKTQGYVSGETGFSHGIHSDRCRLVLNTWKTSDKEPSGKDLHHPHFFLWRIFVAHNKGYEADLRVSQTLINFLRHTWLSELYKDKRYGSDPLFVPSYFFKQPEEVDFYQKHITQYKKG